MLQYSERNLYQCWSLAVCNGRVKSQKWYIQNKFTYNGQKLERQRNMDPGLFWASTTGSKIWWKQSSNGVAKVPTRSCNLHGLDFDRLRNIFELWRKVRIKSVSGRFWILLRWLRVEGLDQKISHFVPHRWQHSETAHRNPNIETVSHRASHQTANAKSVKKRIEPWHTDLCCLAPLSNSPARAAPL